MRWSEATGGIGRCKRVSTGYARQSGSGRVWRSTCGEKRKPKDVTRHSKPCMRRVQDENHPASLLQSQQMPDLHQRISVLEEIFVTEDVALQRKLRQALVVDQICFDEYGAHRLPSKKSTSCH